MEKPALKAGAIVYKITNGTLGEGRWAHTANNNKLAKEIVTKKHGSGIPGEYEVKIYSIDEQLIYSGSLTVTQAEAVYYLKWDGTLVAGSKHAVFEGIGFAEADLYLAATFELM